MGKENQEESLLDIVRRVEMLLESAATKGLHAAGTAVADKLAQARVDFANLRNSLEQRELAYETCPATVDTERSM